jgi:hypothetical protein
VHQGGYPPRKYAPVVYCLVQFSGGNLFTRLIRKRAVSLPPAALLSARIFMGVFYGLIGVLLATPMAVLVIVLIQMLYVQDAPECPLRIPGQHGGAEQPNGTQRRAPRPPAGANRFVDYQ